MDILDKKLDAIDEHDLEQLKQNQIAEGVNLEYKRDLPSDTPKALHKFLSHICSFANTAGGFLIYGIDAKDGVPTSLKPLQIQNLDKEILRLDQIILRGISPRIHGVRIQSIESSKQGYYIIIRIPISYNFPHMVSRNDSSKFYQRSSRGKQQLDVDEIRLAFMRSESLIDKMKEFRKARISLVKKSETPYLMTAGAKLVVHLLPLSAYRLGVYLDLLKIIENRELLMPLGSTYCDYIPNFDGYLSFSKEMPGPEDTSKSYVQIFRNGSIESAKTVGYSWEDDAPQGIEGKNIERWILESIPRYFELYDCLQINPPVYILISLVGVEKYVIANSGSSGHEKLRKIGREFLLVPEVLIESYQDSIKDSLRYAFDTIWNSCGWLGSPTYE